MPTAKTVNEIKGILDRILKLLEPYVRTLELTMAGFFFFLKLCIFVEARTMAQWANPLPSDAGIPFAGRRLICYSTVLTSGLF